MSDNLDRLALARWRLVLGRFADRGLGLPAGAGPGTAAGAGPGGADRYDRMDRALDFLYGREYSRRGVRDRQTGDRTGTPGESVLAIPDWLKQVRESFPTRPWRFSNGMRLIATA